jgi:guanylate kinase
LANSNDAKSGCSTPLLIVISGPSGAGKDAVLRRLREHNGSFYFVVTLATRPPRPEEREGVDYHFISREEFIRMRDQGELFEYADVYEDFKGIPNEEVHRALASGKDILMRLDVQGAASVRKIYPEALLIFLVPEDSERLHTHLESRQTEQPDELQIRLTKAPEELERAGEFDYVVTNPEGQLNEAVDRILEIIASEHQRVPHRKLAQ